MKPVEYLRNFLDKTIQENSAQIDPDMHRHIEENYYGPDLVDVQELGNIAHLDTKTEGITLVKQPDGSIKEITLRSEN